MITWDMGYSYDMYIYMYYLLFFSYGIHIPLSKFRFSKMKSYNIWFDCNWCGLIGLREHLGLQSHLIRGSKHVKILILSCRIFHEFALNQSIDWGPGGGADIVPAASEHLQFFSEIGVTPQNKHKTKNNSMGKGMILHWTWCLPHFQADPP